MPISIGSKSKASVMEKINLGLYDRFMLSGIPCELLYDKSFDSTLSRAQVFGLGIAAEVVHISQTDGKLKSEPTRDTTGKSVLGSRARLLYPYTVGFVPNQLQRLSRTAPVALAQTAKWIH